MGEQGRTWLEAGRPCCLLLLGSLFFLPLWLLWWIFGDPLFHSASIARRQISAIDTSVLAALILLLKPSTKSQGTDVVRISTILRQEVRQFG